MPEFGGQMWFLYPGVNGFFHSSAMPVLHLVKDFDIFVGRPAVTQQNINNWHLLVTQCDQAAWLAVKAYNICEYTLCLV